MSQSTHLTYSPNTPKHATTKTNAQADEHAGALACTGLLSAFAVGLHNFPEGLATFVATLASPTAGAVIAVAIALHNIPEGVIVAMPTYYATGSRLRVRARRLCACVCLALIVADRIALSLRSQHAKQTS